jgi:hypothetical protein
MGLVALCGYAWRHRVDLSDFERHPYAIQAAAWRSVLTVAATPERACPPSVPVVVIYVSRSCPHCQSELRRWSTLVRDDAPESHCIGLAIVAAPGKSSTSSDWLPRELASLLLWDHDGAIARALDVRLVPLAAYVTGKGIEVSRVVGEASESVTTQHLIDLRRISGGDGGAR